MTFERGKAKGYHMPLPPQMAAHSIDIGPEGDPVIRGYNSLEDEAKFPIPEGYRRVMVVEVANLDSLSMAELLRCYNYLTPKPPVKNFHDKPRGILGTWNLLQGGPGPEETAPPGRPPVTQTAPETDGAAEAGHSEENTDMKATKTKATKATKATKTTKVSRGKGPQTPTKRAPSGAAGVKGEGYKGHRAGSRKEQAHKLYDTIGAEKAKPKVCALGIANTTVTSWFSSFKK